MRRHTLSILPLICLVFVLMSACSAEAQKCATGCAQAQSEALHNCEHVEDPSGRETCQNKAKAESSSCLAACSGRK